MSALVAYVGLFLFTNTWGVPPLLPAMMISASIMATFPSTLAMASDLAKSGSVSMTVGIVFGTSGALAALTPALTGYMADHLGLRISLQWLIVFAVAALFFTLLLPKTR